MRLFRELNKVGRYARLLPVEVDSLSGEARKLYDSVLQIGGEVELVVRRRIVFASFSQFTNGEDRFQFNFYAVDRIESDKEGSVRVIWDDLLYLFWSRTAPSEISTLSGTFRRSCDVVVTGIDQRIEKRNEKAGRLHTAREQINAVRKQESRHSIKLKEIKTSLRDISIANERDAETNRILKIIQIILDRMPQPAH